MNTPNEQPQKVYGHINCTCGHPETPGTHRTDGPCYVQSLAPAPAETATPERTPSVWPDDIESYRARNQAGDAHADFMRLAKQHGQLKTELEALRRDRDGLATQLAHLQAQHDKVAGELAKANKLLGEALLFVEQDVQMVADITRHAPLPPKEQAIHDSTESISEKLLPRILAHLNPPAAPKKENT